MNALCVLEPGKLSIVESPMPAQPTGNDVLIKIRAAGICGSDIHILHGENSLATYPRTLGHEIAGEVVALGEDVSHLEIGAHVVVDNVISCGKCYPCKIGRPNVCKELKALGVHTDGGFVEYFKIDSANVYEISKDIPFEHAALCEPYSIAAQAIDRGRLTEGDTVLICGAGPLGLMLLEVCKKIGVLVAIMDTIDARLSLAKELGADMLIQPKTDDTLNKIKEFTNGDGFSLIFEATGNIHVFENCIKDYASQAGRVVILGFPNVSGQVKPVDIMKRELDIIGSRVNNRKFPVAIKWIESGYVQPTKMISHKFNINDAAKAFELYDTTPEKIFKVILTF